MDSYHIPTISIAESIPFIIKDDYSSENTINIIKLILLALLTCTVFIRIVSIILIVQ